MISISERFRFRALASEVFARDATDSAIKDAWTEIAIEWHALANRVAQETGRPFKSLQPNSFVPVIS
jgi:hypothetical protein